MAESSETTNTFDYTNPLSNSVEIIEERSPFFQHSSNQLSHLIKSSSPSGEEGGATITQQSHTHNQHGIGVAGSLASQLCPLGPKDRCTPSQAQAMGQQILSIMIGHENNKKTLPYELQNTFDIFHRCLAVAYGTFFLHLYTKANAPCLLCHGCKSLYPPGQYIHHACPALPPNIVPCRSRMWRRCLVPLVSQDIDKTKQKERWRYVLEKFSHNNMGVVRRNRLPVETEVNLLDMPECKRGRFVKSPSSETPPTSEATPTLTNDATISNDVKEEGVSFVNLINGDCQSNESNSLYAPSNKSRPTLLLEVNQDDDLDRPHDFDDQIQSDEPTITAITTRQQDLISAQNGKATTHKALGLIEELVGEIRKLENELQTTQNSLQFVERQLKAVTKSSNVSEQLVRSLITQDKLTAERDQALQRAQDAEERVALLEAHINQIQKLQNQVLESL